MNGLDYGIIALIALGAVYGLSRGAFRMITSVVSLVAAIWIASLYYENAAAILHSGFGGTTTADAVAGYVILFVAVFALIEIIGRAVTGLLRAIHLGWADRLLGSALGAAIAAVIAGLAVMTLTALLPADAPTLRNSSLAPKVMVYNRELTSYIPDEVKDAYESKRSELFRYWARTQTDLEHQRSSPGNSARPEASK